jgi:hypothetical protein
VGVGREIGGGLDIRCLSAPRLGSVSQFAAVCPAPATNVGATEMVIGHVTGLGHHGSKRENRFCLILTLVNAAKRRAAFHGQRLPEWNRVCIGGDEQARGVRSVAPRVIDPADDRRVTRVHQHLVDVGDEVDLATHARTCCSPACPCGVMALPPRVGFPMRGRPIRSGTVLALPNQASAIGRRRRCCRRGSLESPTAWRSRTTPRIARSSVRAARPPIGFERRDRPRTCSHV